MINYRIIFNLYLIHHVKLLYVIYEKNETLLFIYCFKFSYFVLSKTLKTAVRKL